MSPRADSRSNMLRWPGMKHEGHAIRNRATALRGSLTGSPRSMLGVPSGYVLYAVMYHLTGGEPAQRFFRKQQIADSQKLGLQFDTDPMTKTGIASACRLVRPQVERIPMMTDSGFVSLTPPWTIFCRLLSPLPRNPGRAAQTHLHKRPLTPRRPPPKIIVVDSDDSDNIDDMLLETLDPPPWRQAFEKVGQVPSSECAKAAEREGFC
ncbi:hypothetical protein B0H14DRAFT_2616930 [Mycena olivaceomarginata]|nr:hypothetical protein B0H14DRAFT_2616930 [Mycena olivaceomarginata]